jgi:hypothetical protein
MYSRYRRSYWFSTPAWVERYSASQLAGGSILFIIAIPFLIVAAITGIYWFLAYLAFSRIFWTAIIAVAIISLFNKK